MPGGDKETIINALSNAWIDGQSLRTDRAQMGLYDLLFKGQHSDFVGAKQCFAPTIPTTWALSEFHQRGSKRGGDHDVFIQKVEACSHATSKAVASNFHTAPKSILDNS